MNFLRLGNRTCLAILALSAALLYLPQPARAAYAKDYPVTLYQPDGTPVPVLLTGDEYYNWAHDADGYVIVRHPANGRLVYAAEVNGEVAPTNYVVNKVNPRFAGLVPNIAAKHASAARENSPRTREIEALSRGPRSHNTGSFNNIVIFIRFQDEAAGAFTHAFSEYDNLLNGATGTNTLRNYYKEVSYNTLTINSVYFPTQSGSAVASFQDSHPRAYYKPYDATTNPTGYVNDSGSREYNLLLAALNAVKPAIDASGIVTDSDHDGRCDNVVFVVDGDTTAWATLLWPHMSGFSGGPTLGGATVGTYNFQLENFIFGGRAVGVFCHEMFHSLGAPDLYHYTDNGISTAGSWDIMESDQNPPQHMTTFMKMKYGTWINSIPEITQSGHYTLLPTTSSSNNCYKIKSRSSSTQYFVLEYRQKTGMFENSIPGSGLLIYRIDPTVGNGNAGGPPDELYIFRPGGTEKVNGDINSANFAAGVGRTTFNGTSNPSPFLQDGSTALLDIRNVTTAGSSISFDVLDAYPVATRLGFGVQPGPMKPGALLGPQPMVQAVSDTGVANPNASGTVTVALKPGTGTPGATLGGTKTVTMVNGKAQFTDLTVDLPGSGYRLTATTSGLLSGDSAPFSVTPSGIATSRVNLSFRQAEAERPWADNVCISADAKYVAFTSSANNLASGDTNAVDDVFVRAVSSSISKPASVSSAGAYGNAASSAPALSGTGLFVVFDSTASNLVSDDTDGVSDVFIHDMTTGATERVSVADTGDQANGPSYSGAVSSDGRYVAFESVATNLVSSDTNGMTDIFVRDRVAGTTERISVAPDGTQANASSHRRLAMSNDGNFVSFQSDATNLVPGDTNGKTDVFVWSRTTHACERLSVATGGTQANNSSQDVSISTDGRYATYVSSATNLISGGTNGYWEVFFRDRTTGVTERVSVSTSGGDPDNYSWFPDVSPDGRYVVYDSYAANLVSGDSNGKRDVFLRDRTSGSTKRVNTSSSGAEANDYSQSWTGGHTISVGPLVVFRSNADNLVTTDGNGCPDAFIRNPSSTAILRVSSGTGNLETGGGASYNPSMSADGRYIAFQSNATNLASGHANFTQDVFLRDVYSGATERVSLSYTGSLALSDCYDPSVSADARYVSFTAKDSSLVSGGDGNHQNIYVRDRQAGTTTWASGVSGSAPNGDCYHSTLSPDGRYIAFVSSASNLVSGDTNGKPDVFWRDLQTGATKRVSVTSAGVQGNGSSDVKLLPRISSGGRYVAFASSATNLVTNDTNATSDVFVYDTTLNTIECVSVDPTGKPGNGTSWWASISNDGRYVAFLSTASNLVPGDTNGQSDIFVRDRTLGKTMRVSVGADGAQSTGSSQDPFISATGRYVFFKSTDGNLVANDTNGQTDGFVYDMATGVTTCVSVDDSGNLGNGETSNCMGISADGRWAVFQDLSSNLVPGDTNTAWDIFVRGPLTSAFTLGDAAKALSVAGGLWAVSPQEQSWLDIVRTPDSAGIVDIMDAVEIVRKAAGLDTNP